ncbi:MAG: type IX secretion system sortase PorU [Bacteroidales bacterium]
MRLIVTTLFLVFCFNITFSQITLDRKIEWPTQSQSNNFNGNNYLWFENAIYLNPQTMAPSYFELIKIDNYADNNIILDIEEEKWEIIEESEKKLVQKADLFENQNYQYIRSTESGKDYIQLTVPVIRKTENGAFEKLLSFEIVINGTETNSKSIKKSSKSTKTNSLLSSGNWVKLSVKDNGIYKITYSELQSYGLSNLSNISIWGNGGKKLPYMNNERSPDDLNSIPIYIEKGSDGIFNQGDYILFYAEGVKTLKYDSSVGMWMWEIHPYATEIHYFATTDQPQNLITTLNQSSELTTHTASAYDAIVTFEQNDTNLVKSGREWFGETFDLTSTLSYNTKLSNPEVGSNLKVWLRAAARSSTSSSFSLKVNSVSLGTLYISSVSIGDDLADVASVGSKVYTSTIPDGNLQLDLTYNKSNSASVGWLDFISVNARQMLSYNNSQLLFRDNQSVGTGNITQFNVQNANQNIQVWDVTDINQTKRVSTQIAGSTLSFKQSTDSLRQFIAFDPSSALSVDFIGSVTNQNLHGLNQPDMVIVTHPNFISYAQELANIHEQNDGLSVAVVTNEQVYNEFSSGNPDVSAIRNLMRMLYQRATNENEYPKYLLLFGDGSYDNISTKSNNTNYVLTYQSERSINKTQSFVTDDFFGLLDENEGEASGLMDIGVGRIPAKTAEEAEVVVNKIKQYTSTDNIGNWQSQLCFIGDDEDSNIHMQDANTLADYVRTNHPDYNVNKIFFDAYNQESSSGGNSYPDVTDAINTMVNNGALLINYTGHGNERWLAHEKVVMLDDVLSWKNYKSLSLFVTATCEFSRYDDYSLTSTGEWILLSPKGAGVALLSTTRLVYSNPNFTLNYNFIKNIFARTGSDNTYYTLGDLVKITKNLSGTGYNKRNFSLLGDPALKLRYPKKKIELLTVNNTSISEPIDTLKALSEINLTGRIVDFSGNVDNNYSGTATITLYDKEKEITTLANDGGSTMTFSLRENILYKGDADVENGYFNIDFILPKDINYQYGSGRISLFATDSQESALGNNESIIVGGICDNPAEDNTGPEIEIYLNDENFKDGGICDPNPKFLIKLSDESGINTTGIGIGHDLMATLSATDDDDQKFNLNNYYQSEQNNFKKGSVEYQLSNLSEGEKKLKVKAWDIYNNSSEAEITFNVISDNKLIIKNFYSYPNPFNDNTSMYFEHNQPDADFNIEIQIFNFSGMLVQTLFYNEKNSGNYRIGPITWDGLNCNGSRLGRGMYICRLIVKSSDGQSAQLQQKLLIMR